MAFWLITLISMTVIGAHCDSHSLWHYETGVSSSGSGLPVFSIVGYLDDKQIENYNSGTRQFLPKTEWMKKLGDEYWEGQTQTGRGLEAASKRNVQTVMSRFNQTGGIHIVQAMYGCELRDDGSTAGYNQYGYDGREFMSLDTKSWIYMPTMNEAQITTQRVNSPEVRQGEILKNYLENQCIEELKQFIEYGREDLEKRVRPEVKVWGRRQSDGVTRLQCLVYGFHPRAVAVNWMRNGTDQLLLDEMTPILPHPDGTYQIKVTVDVPTTEGHTYSCRVAHSSLEDGSLSVIWDPNAELKDNMPIVIAVVVVAVLLIIGAFIGLVLWKKRSVAGPAKSNIYVPAPNNEENASKSFNI
ncbi:class I histocompatibility antigen, F10 alpha chain-like isoform 3-T3 [Mantella aurantiaca]